MTSIVPGGYGSASPSQGLPAYGSSKNLYLTSRNVYNFKTSNTYRTRASIARAQTGGSANWGFIADSLSKGFNGVGTTQDSQKAWPEQMKNFLIASGTGITNGGTGARNLIVSTAGTADTDLTGGSGFSSAGNCYIYTFANGSTLQYTSRVAGTIVDICWYDSGSAWSFTVDGGAVNNVPAVNSSTWKRVTVGGFANSVHTVLITSGAQLFVKSVAVNQTTGLTVHNLGFGGATMAGSGQLWSDMSDFSTANSLGTSNCAALPTLDATFIQGGTNDFNAGITPATIAAGYAKIMAQVPHVNTDLFMVCGWRNPTTTDAQWNSYMQNSYQVADALNAVLIDWNDRVGGATQAIANGLLGPDNVHGSYGMYSGFGKAIGDLLLD